MSQLTDIKLIVNGTASGALTQWPGGQGLFSLVGTLGGATVTLQFLGPDGVTMLPVTGVSLSANGSALFTLPPCQIQGVVTGGTSPTGIYATASQVV